MSAADREYLLNIIVRALEEEDAATRHRRAEELLSGACSCLCRSEMQNAVEGSAGGNAAPQDVGRLPPEAIASMPAGYKAAPWGLRCRKEWSGLYAVPIDTPDPREAKAVDAIPEERKAVGMDE